MDKSYQEVMSLKSQFGISNRGDTWYVPMAFTEQGVAMRSGILSSKRAIGSCSRESGKAEGKICQVNGSYQKRRYDKKNFSGFLMLCL